MNNNILKEHIISAYASGVRPDGRKLDEYRNIRVEYGVSAKSAEGSARVWIGNTDVIAGVKLDIGEPFPDKPDSGSIVVNVELLPLSSPEYESGPPSIQAIELARVVDRVIRESGCLDFKKLCIKEGEKVWMVYIDIYPINDEGNLFDAAAIASLAALKDTKFPKIEGETVKYGELTNKSLPLEFLPMSCTVLKIGNNFIIDPNIDEGHVYDGRLTIGMLPDLKICALQKGGGIALKIEDIKAMVELAMSKAKELKKVLEK